MSKRIAAFYNIPEAEAVSMGEAMDRAYEGVWKYPPASVQLYFEAGWLEADGYTDAAAKAMLAAAEAEQYENTL